MSPYVNAIFINTFLSQTNHYPALIERRSQFIAVDSVLNYSTFIVETRTQE